MKKNILTVLFAFIFIANSFAQIKITDVKPEFYYSNGNYSTKTTSDGLYGFVNISVNNFDLIRFGVNQINFNNPEWKYQQTNFSIGGIKNLYPFYVKTSFLYMNGDFDYKPVFSKYKDELYTASIEIDYNFDLFYIGLSFAYTNFNTTSDSLVNLNSKQFGLPITYEPTSNFFITVTPTFTSVSDRGDLYSTEVLIKYSPFKKLSTYLNGFIGKRAYYYNNNLYTIFNQNSTQLNSANLTIEYKVVKKITLVAGYTFTEFKDYSITYYSAGLKLVF